VTSWLNESGAVLQSVERAIDWGLRRFDDMSREYDERLAAAGLDRSAPDVQESDSELRHIHETVEHAQEILLDLYPW
jgi:hypothetical protein